LPHTATSDHLAKGERAARVRIGRPGIDRRARLGSPEATPPCDQFVDGRRERLRPGITIEDRVDPNGEKISVTRRVGVRGEDHDHEISLASRAADEIRERACVAVWQVQVRHEDVEAEQLLEEEVEPARAVGSGEDAVVARLERSTKVVKGGLIVIEDERAEGPLRESARRVVHRASSVLRLSLGHTTAVCETRTSGAAREITHETDRASRRAWMRRHSA